MRLRLSLSLSLNGLSEYSGQTAETKAIRLPSRDQVPLEAPVLRLVSCRASPPPTSMTQSWLSPERVDSNRMRLPSGLQRGWRSAFVELVSWRGGDLPSAAASQRLVVLLFCSRLTVVTW